jgi:alkanesulfonate monooxygenase SsuD/methylene tetrahydromethanopterin reductase-like flavin-dependent oxidoreductase (luciferase family)
MVAVWALAADDHDEAERLASSSRMAMSLLRRGQPSAIPPVDKALRFLSHPPAYGGESDPARRRRAILGSGGEVRAGIEQVAADYHAEEVMVVTITHDHAARRRSYELISEAFGLTGADRAADAATTTA